MIYIFLGVLWELNKLIEGTSETLARLQDLGKQVYLVTNNSTKTIENFYEKVQHTRLNLKLVSILVLIKYLISSYVIIILH